MAAKFLMSIHPLLYATNSYFFQVFLIQRYLEMETHSLNSRFAVPKQRIGNGEPCYIAKSMTASNQESLSNISVILVRTRSAGNIGSTARILGNMGLRNLKLVQTTSSAEDEARMMATSAHTILDQATQFESLGEAGGEEHVLFGTTSGRDRRHSQPILSPRQAATRIIRIARHHKVGLVFGPERSGMTVNELSLCQNLIQIPTDTAFPVLNVSKAVAIVCYEIAQCKGNPAGPIEPLIKISDREEIYERMQHILMRIGFLSQSNPEHIMKALRKILNQSELSPREGQIIRGIISQLEWYVDKGSRLDPKKILKP